MHAHPVKLYLLPDTLHRYCGEENESALVCLACVANMHRPCLLHQQHLLIPVLLLLLLLLFASSTGASVGDSEFIFDGFFGNDLTMDGEASVSDGLLRLTSGQNQSQGHAFYT